MNPIPPSDPNDRSEFPHHPFRLLLPEYATWQASGNDPRQRYPEVVRHLMDCADCREELEELVALLVAFEQPVTSLVPSIRPNLSFLGNSSPSPPVSPVWLDEMGRWLVHFSQAFLALFAPPAQYGMARGTFKLRHLEDAPSGNTLTLELREERESALASLLVQLYRPDQDPFDQGGNRVIVRASDQQWEGVTDDTGSVEFQGLPLVLLPTLRLEVLPPEG